MTRFSFGSHPLLLGFEDLDAHLERTERSGSDSYPPFNIEQRGERRYRITLAVAGFAPEQLAVTLEEGHLTVRGEQDGGADGRRYLHRGIAARKFSRSFVLDPRVEVTDAALDHGLLTVDLVRREPEQTVRTIRIGGPREKEREHG